MKKLLLLLVLCGLSTANYAQNKEINANSTLGNQEYTQGQEYVKANKYLEAIEAFRLAAEKGNAQALYEIGELYHNGGNGIVQNYQTAMEYYLKAAELDNGDAFNAIGKMYFEGVGVDDNYQTAKTYYLKAAAKGSLHLNSMRIIGIICKSEGDYVEAEQWYKRAFDAGDKAASSLLGNLFSHHKNYYPLKALEYYEQAAELGFPFSCKETADYYYFGKGGVTKDYVKAAKYYEKFYEVYYKFAKRDGAYLDNLVAIYKYGGHGVKKDEVKAKHWIDIRLK
ncbi:MAG TPA: tetratricopeptide repeat protein [Flavobacterium sp.]|nr:tetratricopeptide repeat protein [Flavobacterium sp.]